MLMLFASVAVSLVAFILYALERRSKSEPIAWEDATKLSVFGGLVTAGIVFATTSDVKTAVDTISAIELPAVQEMFVGTPSF
jgi:hypothetical protein